MRALIAGDGAPRQVDVPEPDPGDGDVLIAVSCAGINNADVLKAEGRYGLGGGSGILGLECAGTVLACGASVQTVAPGDHVMALARGSFCERVAVPERSLLAVPRSLGLEGSGGLMEAYATAYDALIRQAKVSPGDRVLVRGAAGGVGTAALRMLAYLGIRCIAATRHRHAHAALLSLGADAVVDEDGDLGGPYAAVLELASGAHVPDDLRVLGRRGTVLVIGPGSEPNATIDCRVLMGSFASLRGSTLSGSTDDERDAIVQEMGAALGAAFEYGHLTLPIAQRFALSDAAQAFEEFRRGGKVGKMILDVSSS